MPTISNDLDCTIYVDTDVSQRGLMNLLALTFNGEAESETYSDTVNLDAGQFDVIKNDFFDPAPQYREDFSDGFLRFRYEIEFYPYEDQSLEARVALISKVLEYFWEKSYPAVAACDYEDKLPYLGGGGLNRVAPWLKVKA